MDGMDGMDGMSGMDEMDGMDWMDGPLGVFQFVQLFGHLLLESNYFDPDPQFPECVAHWQPQGDVAAPPVENVA